MGGRVEDAAYAANNIAFDDDDQPLPYPLMETDNQKIFAQERGPERFEGLLMLYNVSPSSSTHGSFSLKLLYEQVKDQIMFNLEQLSANHILEPFQHNKTEEICAFEPEGYVWSIPLCRYVSISVELLDTKIKRHHVSFTTGKPIITRESILSIPYYSYLPKCASVDFNIFADDLTETRGSSFRITAQSDLDCKYKDYHILFSRKPYKKMQPFLDQIVTGYSKP